MKNILNWGLLSTARINRALITPLRASARTRLLGAASRSKSSAQAYVRANDIARAYESYEAMLADPEIDVIYNSLPNHMHAEWTIKALQAGKHVLCEKPFAMTLAEVDAMIAAAKASGKVLAEAFMYRHHPQTLKVQEIMASGVLGKIQIIKGAFCFKLERPGDIRITKAAGGGSIWDVGCYPISYTRMLLAEEPAEVFGNQVLGPEGCDVLFAGQMKFPSGILAQFDCGFVAPRRADMEIVGSDATLCVPDPFNPIPHTQIQIRRANATETIEIEGGELYIGEVEDMCDAVLHGKSPRVSLAYSRGNIATILALINSAERAQPVAL